MRQLGIGVKQYLPVIGSRYVFNGHDVHLLVKVSYLEQ